MRTLPIAFLAGVVLLGAGTPVMAQKVSVDYDRATRFETYRTYSWLPSKNDSGDLWAKRITDNIDSQLTLKGWRKVEPGTDADALVVYNAGVKERTSIEGYDYGYAGGLRWGGGGYSSYTQVVDHEGTLVIDIVDARRKELVWRGTATDMLSDKAEKNIPKVEKAVKKLFAKFPPAPTT